MRLSTQKYIAMCAYIFFCVCKNVSVKLTVVINFIMTSIFRLFSLGSYDPSRFKARVLKVMALF